MQKGQLATTMRCSKGVGHFERKFQGERGVPTNGFGTRKVESLGYRMVKKLPKSSTGALTLQTTDRRQTELP